MKKKIILKFFFILSTLFTHADVFSIKHWKSDYFQILFFGLDGSYVIRFKFIDYEFGPMGEHAYLKWCDFSYTTDGDNYERLMRCEVVDQLYDKNSNSWVKMSNKLQDAVIEFSLSDVPPNGTEWAEDTDVMVGVKDTNLTLKWYVSSDFEFKDFQLNGIWCVNGLYCADTIKSQKYQVVKSRSLNSDLKTDSKVKNINYNKDTHKVDNNDVCVYKDADFVVINRVGQGENIMVYTTSGAFVKSMIAVEDIVKIKLTTNQIYIVKVGLVYYKVAL